MSESAPGLLPTFRSRQQLQLLGHLFVNCGSGFSIAELGRATGIPQSTVSREIGRLAKAGIVQTRQVGRAKVVEADSGSPYFPELLALLLKAMGPAAFLQDELARVAGVEEAYIFGSWARRYGGEIGPPPADVDMLVIGVPDPDEVDAVCQRVGRRLRLEVNSVVLSREEWSSPDLGFVKHVRAGPLVPLAGEAA